jgi:hypothetical protein
MPWSRSNCDHLKFYIAGKLVAEADPDRKQFPHLSVTGRHQLGCGWGGFHSRGAARDR